MTVADSLADPAAFERLMTDLDTDSAAYGRGGARLCAAIRSLFHQAAFGSGSPSEKVRDLRQAQTALGALEAAIHYRPRSGGYDVSLTGVQETKAALTDLEATFRAFGWMRGL